MGFWQYARHGAISVITLFVFMLSIIALPALAQETTPEAAWDSAEATPEAAWNSAEATTEAAWDGAAADGVLTLVWQTEFTPEAMVLTPGDMAFDSDGNIYVTTQSSNL